MGQIQPQLFAHAAAIPRCATNRHLANSSLVLVEGRAPHLAVITGSPHPIGGPLPGSWPADGRVMFGRRTLPRIPSTPPRWSDSSEHAFSATVHRHRSGTAGDRDVGHVMGATSIDSGEMPLSEIRHVDAAAPADRFGVARLRSLIFTRQSVIATSTTTTAARCGWRGSRPGRGRRAGSDVARRADRSFLYREDDP